ncbi:MAG: hypothetical protein V9E99_16980 [Microthrixaceae bacterium]
MTHHGAPARRSDRLALAAVALVGGLTLLVARWGQDLIAAGTRLSANAAPFHGRWRDTVASPIEAAAVVPPVVGAVVVVVSWPLVARRLHERAMPWAAALVSLWWAVQLAAVPGVARVWEPLTSRYEYLRLARSVDDLGRFLSTYVDRLPGYPTHVRGHPPGAVVGFWVLDRLGFDARAVGFTVFAIAASSAAAVVITLARLGGAAVARRGAVIAGLTPSLVWWSAADAVFMALAAWSVAFAAVAATASGPARRRAAYAAAGACAGLLVISTYGAAPLLAPLAAVLGWGLWSRRTHRGACAFDLAALAIAASAPVVALGLAGFSWFDGFAATRAEYWAGAAANRPFGYFAIANVVLVLTAAGPAAIGGLARCAIGMRRWPVRVPAWSIATLGAIAGVAIADMSGYSKGEVERIWLPLVPWLAVAGSALMTRTSAARLWLGAQLATGLALQIWLGTPW